MQRAMTALAHGAALVGGAVLIIIILLTCVSIAGRVVGLGEIRGTYEILEAGVAFAIFCFFPICQLYGAHATVDVFTSGLSHWALLVLKAFWEVVLTAIIILLSWRLFGGLERYLANGETTLFLQFPVWWSYAASFAASVVASVTAVYCALARVATALSGRSYLPSEAG